MELTPESSKARPQSTRGNRIRRACISCRQSKVRCDGKEPCGRCEQRDLMCVLGVDRREVANRKSLPRKINRATQIHESHQPETLASKDQVNLLNREVFCSISSSEAASSAAIHLHYGPSSSFVFMQQLHKFLFGEAKSKHVVMNGQSANYTAEAVSEFGYSSIFFGRVSGSQGDGPSQILGVSVLANNFNPDLLPFELASNFLEKYLSSLHHVLPFCEHATLRKLLYTWYSTMNTPNIQMRDSTLIIAVLASGATLTDQSAWGDALFLKAKANLDSWGDAVSLRSVQVLMLLSEFHTIHGRPNSAILAIGSAAHRALAIGLHHEMSSSERHQPVDFLETDRSRAKERQATFWALYARDRCISLSIGRPASINDMDIEVPDPIGNPNLLSAVTLSRISNKVYYDIYGRKKGSVAEFCKKVQGIRDELNGFHKSLTPELWFPLDETDAEGSTLHLTTAQMVSAFEYFQILIILLRPCLVLGALGRRAVTDTRDSAPIIPVEWLSWLDEASKSVTKISMHIIFLFADSIEHNPLISRMRHSRYFLEGACLVLLFDIVRDPGRKECQENFNAVAKALHCFALLPADRLILISTSAITRILQLTNDLVAKYKIDQDQQDDGTKSATVRLGELEPHGNSIQIQTADAPVNTNFTVDSEPSTTFNNIELSAGDENLDFWNDDIFGLSYYLWTEDGAPPNPGY